MSNSRSVRVILVDDHLLFRIGLRAAFAQSAPQIKVVGEAGSAEEFFALLPTVEADTVLLDIALPDRSGIEIARQLKEEYPQLKILILSAENDTQTVLTLLEVGIDGFVSKSVPVDELCHAIDYVTDGAEYFGRDIARIIHDVRISKNIDQTAFTPREMEIIDMCAHGMSSKETATSLNISTKTIEAHKNNIFKKLGINSSVELVRYALQNGIVKL